MPRDASGNYTLPAGNPVVTGTTVDASWANDTMDDITTVLTDSLSRSGDGGMLVAMEFASGVVGAPGITWTSEPTSGFYLAAANDMRVSIAGSDRVRFRADAANPFQIWKGAAWANVLYASTDATITGDWVFSGALTVPEATVTAHEAALTILETQISDGALLARFADQTTVFNNTDDAAGDVQVGSASAAAKTQSLSLVNDTLDVAWVNATTVYGFYDYTNTEWGIRCIPSTSKVEVYGQEVLVQNVDVAITGTWTFDAPVTGAGFGTGGKVKDGLDNAQPIGYNVMPLFENDADETFDLAHNGQMHHTDDADGAVYTCDQDADIPVGATYPLCAEHSGGTVTVVEGAGVTLKWQDGAGGQTGDRTVAAGSVVSIYKYSLTVYWIWGNGIS